ncbi:uncharacterized protein [Aegilops tauschii subsp. strangulata]|uniref:uncharacterized protein n=1 Tax=Aegilops tauschii subsp. strangulata TaxID=200361 RepID=UPI003CC88EA3
MDFRAEQKRASGWVDAQQPKANRVVVLYFSLRRLRVGGWTPTSATWTRRAPAAIQLRAPATGRLFCHDYGSPRPEVHRRPAGDLLLRQGSGSPRPQEQIHRRPAGDLLLRQGSGSPRPQEQIHRRGAGAVITLRFQLMNAVCYDQAMASICW